MDDVDQDREDHAVTEKVAEEHVEDTATPDEQVVEGIQHEETKTEEPNYNKESLLADLHKERNRRRELTTKLEEAESKVTQSADLTEKYETLEKRYGRLEAFLTNFGGSIGKAMDSRSFTEKLFNSDADISEIVNSWHKDNPSQTSSALSGGAGAETSGQSINDLLRAAR